jgi:CubicO group peptidase (beta-lactamase class C family)
MTATIILQPVQEGKLALDDPISTYRADVPNGDQLTIAQLAEVRSGLVDSSFDKGFDETLDADPRKVWYARRVVEDRLLVPLEVRARREVRPHQHQLRPARPRHRAAHRHVMAEFYGAAAVPGGDPATAPTTADG